MTEPFRAHPVVERQLVVQRPRVLDEQADVVELMSPAVNDCPMV